MALPVWPLTWQPEYDNSSYTVEDVSHHSQNEDGVHTGRRKWTKERKTYLLSFKKIPDAEHTALLNFYDNVVYGGALPFAWTCPWNDSVLTVYIVEYGTFVPSWGNGENRWTGTVKIMEV